jgi:agmatine deiminase
MPGEFEPHKGTYMIWPQRPDTWRCGGKHAQKVFAQTAAAIGKYEPLTMLANSACYAQAQAELPSYVRTLEMPSDDAWARDTGPSFVINDKGSLRGIDWTFNAWGGLVDGLYSPWNHDDAIAEKICDLEQADRYRTDNFVLEGGSIHVDGDGTVLATEACLLSPGRNPGMSKEAIEDTLKKYLNAEKIIWLKNGIYLDETNEHVDNICCFVKPAVVALAWTENTADPQYAFCKDAWETLASTLDARGRKLQIYKIPLPAPQIMTAAESAGIDPKGGAKPRKAGDRMAASYINYYVCNGAIIMPAFNDPMDGAAKKILQTLYPDRDIIQIYAREILLGGGNIHCITQQTPQARDAGGDHYIEETLKRP